MTKSFQNRISTVLTALLLILFSSYLAAQEPVFVVTGFEPFNKQAFNPSWEAVQLLPDYIGDVRIIKIKLRVSYKEGFVPLQNAIKQYNPIGILAMGVNDFIISHNLEPKAYNVDDDIMPDNDGTVLRAWPGIPGPAIIRGGPSVLEPRNLPINKIITSLKMKNILITQSSDKYRFLCNHVYYLMLNELSKDNSPIPAGFMHVPPITKSSINNSAVVLEEAVRAILENMHAEN